MKTSPIWRKIETTKVTINTKTPDIRAYRQQL